MDIYFSTNLRLLNKYIKMLDLWAIEIIYKKFLLEFCLLPSNFKWGVNKICMKSVYKLLIKSVVIRILFTKWHWLSILSPISDRKSLLYIFDYWFKILKLSSTNERLFVSQLTKIFSFSLPFSPLSPTRCTFLNVTDSILLL